MGETNMFDPHSNSDRAEMTRNDWAVWCQAEAAHYAERARNEFFPAKARNSYAASAADLYRRARAEMGIEPGFTFLGPAS